MACGTCIERESPRRPPVILRNSGDPRGSSCASAPLPLGGLLASSSPVAELVRSLHVLRLQRADLSQVESLVFLAFLDFLPQLLDLFLQMIFKPRQPEKLPIYLMSSATHKHTGLIEMHVET